VSLNEQENRIDTEGGTGLVTFKKTEDKMGYFIEVKFEGSVMEADLPNDWKKELEKVANLMEKELAKIKWLK
jgi:hypothetical protein